MNFQDRLYDKQARLISAQQAQIASLLKQIETELRPKAEAGEWYEWLARSIAADGTLQAEWRRFVAILTLAKPNLPPEPRHDRVAFAP